jgi:hypothetical protein
VYRQATILLAGLAIDPANFLFSLQRSPRRHGRLAGGRRVCSNSIEKCQRADRAWKSGGTNYSPCVDDLK